MSAVRPRDNATISSLNSRRPFYPRPSRPRGRGLLDEVLARGVAEIETRQTLDEFLNEQDWSRAIELWINAQGLSVRGLTLDRIGRVLSRDLARLDGVISRQVNAILHNPRFQQLEASWRGLYFLTQQAQNAREQIEGEGGKVQVRIEILNITKTELIKDFEKAAEFDRSQIWRKVYEEEFGMAGGEPFGVMVADYEFANHPQDVELLGKMAEVAAGSFCPFIAGATPKLMQIDDFATLEQPLNLSGTFEQLPYLRWRSLRKRDDTRFIGLTLPRVLRRLPYEDDGSREDGFRFREEIEAPDYRNYLWGSAAYAFGAVLIRAFGGSRWFADIRGMERDVEAGGVVTDLPVHSFATDRRGIAAKASLEVRVGESQEQELSQLGLIPLCHAWDTELQRVLQQRLAAQAEGLRRANGVGQRQDFGDAAIRDVRFAVRALPEGPCPQQAWRPLKPAGLGELPEPLALGLHFTRREGQPHDEGAVSLARWEGGSQGDPRQSGQLPHGHAPPAALSARSAERIPPPGYANGVESCRLIMQPFAGDDNPAVCPNKA